MIPKAIVFDLDGTVLNSSSQISKRNFEAILDVQKKGIRTIFATARPPRVAGLELLDVLSENSYMVYYNGAYYKCTKNLDDCHFGIAKDIGAKLIDFIEKKDESAVTALEIKDKLFGYKDIEYGVLDFMKKDFNPEIVDIEVIKATEITKVLIADFDYAEDIARKFHESLNVIVTDEGRLVQIMSSQAGKEIAVSQIADNLGILMSEVMCFGDDYNDLELFKAVGHSVAMGNAVEDVKTAATEITLTNNEDGVAVVLERVLREIG